MARISAMLLSVAALILTSPFAIAADPVADPSTRDIIDALKPSPERPHMRGISIEAPKPPPSLDMRVNFEFNSATLTADARKILDRLGEAFNSPELAGSRFLVAGHTDAVGGAEVNQVLSERRATAVKAYLVGKHGVVAGRIDIAGFGESRLLDPAHPDAAINRRVQVTNIGQ